MKNFYMDSDFKYSEIAIALHNYTYGDMVKFHIPSLMPFLEQNSPTNKSISISKSNIVNKNSSILGISNCTSCNYIQLHVPREYIHPGRNIWDGRKGDKYAILFVGGNINNCTIVGRID